MYIFQGVKSAPPEAKCPVCRLVRMHRVYIFSICYKASSVAVNFIIFIFIVHPLLFFHANIATVSVETLSFQPLFYA